ncbi:MAG: TauD/TfdA family dioxygenase [Burkholderiaceae bacterium]|nr:TauD/TfdA family dioxygenase [Burkholderiaceae bacterium]
MPERVSIQNIRTNQYRHIDVRPVAGALGAEIHGVDLSRPVSSEVFKEIHAAFLENLVVFFMDQDITPQHQCDFARRFGPLTRHPFLKTMDNYPEVLLLKREKDEDVQVIGRRWHSDSSFQERPPLASLLYSQEVPPYGGDTLFCNLYLAYDMLSPGLRRQAESLRVVHSAAHYATPKAGGAGLTVLNNEAIRDAGRERVQPLVRIHPETGRKALWITGLDYGRSFEDMTREESMPLLSFFQDLATQEILSCRHRWRKGTLALWDNRCTQHLALDDYLGFRREMYRVEVEGDVPFGPAMPRVAAQLAA